MPKLVDPRARVKLDAEMLIPNHPLFKKLSIVTVKELLDYCVLLRVKLGVTIYNERDPSNQTSYIILFGKFLLHTAKLGPIGAVTTGDSLGEEGLLELRSRPITLDVKEESGALSLIRRDEMATAEEESFILGFTKENFDKVRERLFKLHLQMDWFSIINHMKHQWVQKKSWR